MWICDYMVCHTKGRYRKALSKSTRPLSKALYVSVAEEQNQAVDSKDISSMYPDWNQQVWLGRVDFPILKIRLMSEMHPVMRKALKLRSSNGDK